MSELFPAGSLPNLSDLWGPGPSHEEENKPEKIVKEEPRVELGSLDSLFSVENKEDKPTLDLGEVKDTKEVKLTTPPEEQEPQPTVFAINDELVKPSTPVVETSSAAEVEEEPQTQLAAEEDPPRPPVRISPKSSSSKSSSPAFKYEKASSMRHIKKGLTSSREERPWETIDVSMFNTGKHKALRTYFSTPTTEPFGDRQLPHLMRKEHRDAARQILRKYKSEAKGLNDGRIQDMDEVKCIEDKEDLLLEQCRLREQVSELQQTCQRLRKALNGSVELLKIKDAEIASLRDIISHRHEASSSSHSHVTSD